MSYSSTRDTTSYISLPQKVILLTYSKPDKGQYFYDCGFSLPTDIPPGPTGYYQVTFNEVLFQHSHPIITPDDYIKITLADGTTYTITFQVKIYKWSTSNMVEYCNSQLPNDSLVEFVVNSVTKNGFYLAFKSETAAVLKNQFMVETSVNIGYIMNNIALVQYAEQYRGEWVINWPVTRMMGPYMYIVTTNLIPLVPTINEEGKKFNMTLLTYNTTGETADTVQMASTMQCITSNITTLRVKLIDDQGRPVELTSPMYIQLTVQPYIPPGSSSNIGYYK